MTLSCNIEMQVLLGSVLAPAKLKQINRHICVLNVNVIKGTGFWGVRGREPKERLKMVRLPYLIFIS